MRNITLITATLTFLAGTASAATLGFESILSGDQEVPPVVTEASGSAEISVDEDAQTIDFSLAVTGISIDGLFDDLIAAPVGPVHLHNAPIGVNGPIVIPFAFDPATYTDTADGFEVNVSDFLFDDAVALSGSLLSFDEFLDDLIIGDYYINVHSDVFTAGEIRGQVAAVAAIPLPASLFFLGAGLGLLGALRKRKAA